MRADRDDHSPDLIDPLNESALDHPPAPAVKRRRIEEAASLVDISSPLPPLSISHPSEPLVSLPQTSYQYLTLSPNAGASIKVANPSSSIFRSDPSRSIFLPLSESMPSPSAEAANERDDVLPAPLTNGLPRRSTLYIVSLAEFEALRDGRVSKSQFPPTAVESASGSPCSLDDWRQLAIQIAATQSISRSFNVKPTASRRPVDHSGASLASFENVQETGISAETAAREAVNFNVFRAMFNVKLPEKLVDCGNRVFAATAK